MLITKEIPNSISAEAYRNLRTKIKYYSIDKEIQTIVVTSSETGEGKSTVSGNLAISLSCNGSRVLVIDCDLRRPSLHKKFDVSNMVGLTDYLIGSSKYEEVLQKVNNNLFVLTSGTRPPNPAEIIGSNRFEKFIKELKINFDYIILDTPPVRAVADSQILAAKADATLLVVKSGRSKRKSIYSAYEDLTKVKANVIGTVINALEIDKKDNYYYRFSEDNKKIFRFNKRRH
ncbi:MAG: CpsD/CapB family tyrosine-protein kinase [Clostridium sp.]|nr:CpsD/CapB family tyrosine-protein kinase [Clostridium sp.]